MNKSYIRILLRIRYIKRNKPCWYWWSSHFSIPYYIQSLYE